MRPTQNNARRKIVVTARQCPDATWEQLYASCLNRLRNFIARRWKAGPNLADEVATMALSLFWEKRLLDESDSDPGKLFGRLVFLARDCLCKLGRQRRRLRAHEVPLRDSSIPDLSALVWSVEAMLEELTETLSPQLKQYLQDQRLHVGAPSGAPPCATNRWKLEERIKQKIEEYLHPPGEL
jgi:hypothetical protein